MEQFSLTVAKVVEADRLALAERRLTAMLDIDREEGDYTSACVCVYVYGDPAKNIGCAIGVALPLLIRQLNDWSNRQLDDDMFELFNTPSDKVERVILMATQWLHDWWAKNNLVPTSYTPPVDSMKHFPQWAKDFFHTHETEKVSRELFEAWLSLVEANYLKA